MYAPDGSTQDDNFSGFTQSNLETECCFDIKLIFTDQQPPGFKNWTKKLKFEKCKIYLPDTTYFDVRSYLDMNKTLDNGSLTKYLLNRYNESL